VLDIAHADRGNTPQARAALAPAVEKLRQGLSIAIAPPGTRSPTPRLDRVKKDAFHMALQPGVPIVIRNAGDVMWKRSPLIRKGTIDVTVLAPVPTNRWKVEELERVAQIRQPYLDTLAHWPAVA
jgi:putative phosphoserine phosphatase / 1-acylglycerol-3-phosphate O-acyltransferase